MLQEGLLPVGQFLLPRCAAERGGLWQKPWGAKDTLPLIMRGGVLKVFCSALPHAAAKVS